MTFEGLFFSIQQPDGIQVTGFFPASGIFPISSDFSLSRVCFVLSPVLRSILNERQKDCLKSVTTEQNKWYL